MNRILPLPRKRRAHKFILPDIPEADWCDYRREYEAGMSLRAIAEKHYVDPRTVRSAIEHNVGSAHLGRQHSPRKLSHFENEIRSKLPELQENADSITALSRRMTLHLQESGYTGSERTVRNYLHTLPSVTSSFKKKSSQYRPKQT